MLQTHMAGDVVATDLQDAGTLAFGRHSTCMSGFVLTHVLLSDFPLGFLISCICLLFMDYAMAFFSCPF